MFDSSGTEWPRHEGSISHPGKDLKTNSDLICVWPNVMGLCYLWKQYPAPPQVKFGSPFP